MNPPSDSDARPSEETLGRGSKSGPPINWREALLLLIASRVSIIQLESKDAAKEGIRRISLVVGAILCAFFAWGLLISGTVAGISIFADWPWYWVAIGFSGLHLLIAIFFAKMASPSRVPAFPVTRAEFQKDREWIENLHTRTSND